MSIRATKTIRNHTRTRPRSRGLLTKDFIYLAVPDVLLAGVSLLGKFLVLAPQQVVSRQVTYHRRTLVSTHRYQDHPILLFHLCESEIYGEKVF